MDNQSRRAGKLALRIIFIVIALLVLANGVVLLCETDPEQFYRTLFNKITASASVGP